MINIQEFDELLERFQAAAKAGDLDEFRRLDHQLRSMALAMIGGMPDLQPNDDKYFDALREAVFRLGATAGEIHEERKKLKTRRSSDRKIRLAYSRDGGRS
ncbi:MAG: hypothetical protein JXR13_17645 [Thalassovita sp.]